MNRVVRSFLVSATGVVVAIGGVSTLTLTAQADGDTVVVTGGHETSGPLPTGELPQLPKPGDPIPTITSDPTVPGSDAPENPGDELPDPGQPTDPGSDPTDPGTGNPTDLPDPGDPTGDPGNGDPGTGDPGTGDPGTGDPGTGNPGGGLDIGALIMQILQLILKIFGSLGI